jgi:hypothetical protein
MPTIVGLFVERKFWNAADAKVISKYFLLNQYVMIRRYVIEYTVKIYFSKLPFTLSFLKVLEANMRLKLSGPDYKNVDPEEALEDFRRRVANYEKAYEPISVEEEKTDVEYCKLINVGKKVRVKF